MQAGEPGRSNSCGSTSKSHQGCRPQGILFHHTARPSQRPRPLQSFHGPPLRDLQIATTMPQGAAKGRGKKKFQPWKGHGKGQKGHSKGKHGDLPLVSQTPDGRDICFAFNSQWAIAMSAESVVVTATMRPESTAKYKRAGVRKSDPLGPCSPEVSYGCCISFAATKEKLTSNIFCMSLAN